MEEIVRIKKSIKAIKRFQQENSKLIAVNEILNSTAKVKRIYFNFSFSFRFVANVTLCEGGNLKPLPAAMII
jgi:hypothetical protein